MEQAPFAPQVHVRNRKDDNGHDRNDNGLDRIGEHGSPETADHRINNHHRAGENDRSFESGQGDKPEVKHPLVEPQRRRDENAENIEPLSDPDRLGNDRRDRIEIRGGG